MNLPLALAAVLSAALLISCSGVREPSPAVPARANVIPLPATVEHQSGSFTFTPETRIIVDPGNADAARIGTFLADLIGNTEETRLPVSHSGEVIPAGSVLITTRGAASDLGEEGYSLTVTPERVTISAPQSAGLFYGVQTLRHLLPGFVEYEAAFPRPITVPSVRIVDQPRFGWRGAMLDVSRHFFSPDDVKRYIDLLALLKLNRLHLHLSDDQGWRIEIKSWPNLTEHGGSTQVGGGPGGYFTQEEYADLNAYAGDRFITIVPEIDMPGHTNAALASYPELNCDGVAPPLFTGTAVGFSTLCVERDVVYQFVDDVVREIGALTNGPYFHIGGDEVEKLTEEQYAHFIERAQNIVASHNLIAVGWDEIAEAPLLPSSIIQLWRPTGSRESLTRAVADGTRVILSPANRVYLDMKYDESTVLGLNWAGYSSVRHAYDWDPAALIEGVDESQIAGVEAPLWSETLANMRDVEFMAFPRLAGAAELGWSPAAGRSWREYRLRLAAQAPRWTALGINFNRDPSVPWED